MIARGTEDKLPPFRNMPTSNMSDIARTALKDFNTELKKEEDQESEEIIEFRDCLHELFTLAKDKLNDHGHGCTYYFHELYPELSKKITNLLKKEN